MNQRKLAVCLMLMLLGLAAERIAYATASTNVVTARAATTGSSMDIRVKVYLVALGDNGKKGKKIGCEDSLVAVDRRIEQKSMPLRAALSELLSMPEEYNEGGQQLGNYWKGSNLKVKSVALRRGTATIQITGTLTVAGICDEPRIVEQIEATARQFPAVKRVRVFVNGTPLKEAIR